NNDVLKILAIVRDSHYAEVRLTVGDFTLHLHDSTRASLLHESSRPRERETDVSSAVIALVSAHDSHRAAHDTNQHPRVTLLAPVLGVFLQSRRPDDKPLVNVGDNVGPGDTVGFIRVLDQVTPVKAGISGTVSEIAVQHACLVEYEQALMILVTK
ncbi:MAG TPA: hypothetical protein VLN59_18475, partial [Burkholderiales bacterium]|nr:hypothetical protein [Burkholderiales bacterium]